MDRTIYFGPPGTGKTTTLLRRMEDALRDGVAPEDIAFLTFTRRARAEAIDRVKAVLGIVPKDLPHFRTIHSMAFKALRLKQGDVMGMEQLKVFGAGMGLRFNASAASEQAAEGISSQEVGDVLLALDNLSRLRKQDIKQTWTEAGALIEWPRVQHFADSYRAHKAQTGLLDFTDVLMEYAKGGSPLRVDVAFVDEAQDLSRLQWECVERAVGHAPTQYVAGDDDQAIYRWAGADVEAFTSLPGQRIVLSHSHRLPAAVHALSQRLVRRIKHRVPKEFTARDEAGSVTHHAEAASVVPKDGEQWLWLVRNRFLLGPLQDRLRLSGVVYTQHGHSSIVASERDMIYTWERLRAGKAQPVERVRDMYEGLRTTTQVARGYKALPHVAPGAMLTMAGLRESHGLLADGTWFEVFNSIPDFRRSYYRQLLREKRSLQLEPTVQLETIHGAKGAEADHVALFSEQSRRVWNEAQKTPDDEHRVWYVGATRARKHLHIVAPGGRWAYTFPK